MSLKKLISWSEKEYSHLPWRQERSLYRTLVSEIMLQQTTVGTVKNHFERFLTKFPTLKSLALASEEELIVAWKGLGYYRRAKNLKKISESLYRDHGGEFPHSAAALQEIPGIGPYTSQALIAIGMDKVGLAVDANLERVIARLYGLKIEKGPKLQKKIAELFLQKEIFVGFTSSHRALNEALMDLGRTYCQARKASCELCPLSSECMAFKSKKPLQFPIEKSVDKRPAAEHELELARIYITKKDKLLVYKKADSEWLSGQYEVPTFVIKSTDENFKQYPSLPSAVKLAADIKVKTGITKYKIVNHIIKSDEKSLQILKFNRAVEWRDLTDENSNFSTATLKGLSKIL